MRRYSVTASLSAGNQNSQVKPSLNREKRKSPRKSVTDRRVNKLTSKRVDKYSNIKDCSKILQTTIAPLSLSPDSYRDGEGRGEVKHTGATRKSVTE
ncbi:MAG: hypothetical protein QM751_06640 [Paludibacteraceae bacterium]